MISPWRSTTIDKRIAVRVTNTTESPYLIKKHTQTTDFSVVTPEQYKHIKPVDRAVLSMIPQGDPELTAYHNELLKSNKPEQQNNTLWFPAPENPGKAEDQSQYRHESSKNWLNSKTKKNSMQKKAQQQKFQSIWLDWHTSNRNRKASNWGHPTRLKWHFS